MKLNRKAKMNMAGVLACVGLLLLAVEPVREDDYFTLVWTKVAGLVLLGLVAYICDRDVRENGVPK